MLRRSILIGISLGLIVMSGARAWGGFAARAVRFEPASGSASAPAAAALSFESSPFGFLPANVGQLPNPSYAEARDIGVHWDRPAKTMYWSEIQPDLNLEPNFSIADAGFAAIPAGINIVENVDVENHRNPVGYNRPGSYLPIDIVKYQAFVSAAVQRYDGDGVADAPNLHQPIKYWQVSNELSNNLSDFPQFQALTYNAIKAACADCKVLIGGVGGMPNGS